MFIADFRGAKFDYNFRCCGGVFPGTLSISVGVLSSFFSAVLVGAVGIIAWRNYVEARFSGDFQSLFALGRSRI
jgi:hypothetical protein